MICCIISFIIINGIGWTGKQLVIINHECYDIPIYQETVVWKNKCWQQTMLSLFTCGYAAAKEKGGDLVQSLCKHANYSPSGKLTYM